MTPGKRRVIKIIAERPVSQVEICIRPRGGFFSFHSRPTIDLEGDESPFTKRHTVVSPEILWLEKPETTGALAFSLRTILNKIIHPVFFEGRPVHHQRVICVKVVPRLARWARATFDLLRAAAWFLFPGISRHFNSRDKFSKLEI